MKARVKATGEIVEINESSTIYDAGMCHIYNASELESVLDNPDYWTRLEHTYAGMAMQAMLTSPEILQVVTRAENLLTKGYAEKVAIVADKYAHALVEKMKEKRK